MLILPPGHWQEVAQPRPSRRRDKWFVAIGVGGVAVIVIFFLISLTTHQRTSKDGCIDVSAATMIGGSELYKCGAGARSLCAEPSNGDGAAVPFRVALDAACRKAGLPLAAAGSQP